MKRSIKRSLVRPTKASSQANNSEADGNVDHADAVPPAFKRASSGAGSAWKSGAVAKAQGDLDEAREKLSADILNGSRIIEIDPELLSDPIGSDRRDDWIEQEEFKSFVKNIEENGQDMPVLVWPKDPDWRPDEIDPENLERVQFLLLAGRRRREAAKKLGRPVRAVLASQEGRDSAEATFRMLVLRFRENDEREDLSAFERLLSIGQMYEELCNSTGQKHKAKDFAERIGVHESIISRARSVLNAKSEILNAFKNVYDMSFRELQEALASLTEKTNGRAVRSSKPKTVSVTRKIGSRKLVVSSKGGKLSVSAAGLKLDKQSLEGLSDVIVAYLEENGSDKS